MVPLTDLRRRVAACQPEMGEAVARVLASGRLLLGDELAGFEQEFADFTGRRFAVGVASGTDAISLALRALDVGPGDEVVVPAFTAVPTLAAVCAVGAVPVPVDIDERTGAIDPVAARAAVGPRTRAIVPVHLYGLPSDEVVEDLLATGLPVVEDAAHAHGALRGGRTAAAAYSFYPTKNLGGIGDGGAVVTDDESFAAKVRLLRHHGMRELYLHEEIATNARMSEIEAAGLRVGLARLGEGNRRRREIADRYRAAAPELRWHPAHPRHVYHLCVLRVADRDAFRARIGFETGVHYPRAATLQPAYRRFARFACPRAEAWAAECVSLPCFPELRDDEVDE
ncbi:MAG: DegT/DnrJ/EryC1/StrS family aminotransferase, partial [Alphaproteobacteria bacterium]